MKVRMFMDGCLNLIKIDLIRYLGLETETK